MVKNNNDVLGGLDMGFEDAVALISHSTEDYIFCFNISKDYYYITEKAVEKFDFPSNHFYNASEIIMNIVYEQDVELLEQDVYELKNRLKTEHNLEYRWYDRNGNIVWISCRGMIAKPEVTDGDVVLVGRISEIGADKKADNITGLKMENQIYPDFKKHMPDDAGNTGSMLMIGIDNFKGINDMYGVETGDSILKSLAKCIDGLKDERAFLYRVKGDGFLIVDYIDGSAEKSRQLYIDIRNGLSDINAAFNYKAIYTISGGIVEFTKQDDISKILYQVAFSLGQAKRNGKNCTFTYDQQVYDAYIRRLDIQEKLRLSIYHDFAGFEVFYQPIVNPDNGKLVGAEALLRWKCEEYQNVYPTEFIPILEESALIILVGKWVFTKAIKQCKEWQKFIPNFKININLSYIQIKKSNVIDDILDCIDCTGINPGTVTFEFTESNYIDSDSRIRKLINAFCEKGLQLAIDDFGTGYSNLAMLQSLNVNVLKLDRTFVSKSLQTDFDFKLISHIVYMAHSIGLKVCMEGIETMDEQERLSPLRPDYIQGYLYGRPMDKDSFEEKFFSPDSYIG